MKLDDIQKKKVTAWINEGLKLSEIQKRIGSEFGLSLTYMEVRMLVDDLKVMPKDPTPPPAPKLPGSGPATEGPGAAAGKTGLVPPSPEKPASAAGGVSVSVDTVARPGALVSGSVKFSDGQTAVWYMDQMGRLGVAPNQQGYKPSAADVQAFQEALEGELTKLGM
jgi:hypothetical protein